MAAAENIHDLSIEASADLSTHQYKFVIVDGNGQVALAGAAALADGILLDKPNAQGVAARIGIGGRLKVVASAAILQGAEVACAANGLAVTAVATNPILGKALTAAGAANEVIEILFQPRNVKA